MNSGRDPLEALADATAKRKEFLQKHPDFLREDEFDAATPPPVGVPETSRQVRNEKKILPGAAAHDLRQRKLLGEDF